LVVISRWDRSSRLPCRRGTDGPHAIHDPSYRASSIPVGFDSKADGVNSRAASGDDVTDIHQPGNDLPLWRSTSLPNGSKVGHVVRAMRPLQWTKNLLVFVPPAASGTLDQGRVALHALAAFGIFCAAASGTYLVNDAVDAEADRRHPIKRYRPVAGGAVSGVTMVYIAVALIASALASAWLLGRWQLLLVIGAYALIGIAYTVRLKRVPVIELMAVASCFSVRAISGAVATHAPLSSWFLVVASFGALFVVAGKRTAEHVQLGDERGEHRAVLDSYTLPFLRSTVVLAASVTVIAYGVWAFERASFAGAHHHLMWIELTVVPTLLGVVYLTRLFDKGEGGSPEDLVLNDRVLQVLGFVWLALFWIGLYG
jgi:decaprenyl-phosphate phosphoribosyltransferase